MNEEMKARLEELCKDQEYVKYVLSLGSAEAMSKELESKDVELSAEEIRTIGKLLKKKENGELTDEELEEVSGGFITWAMWVGIALGVAGAVAAGSVTAQVLLC